jgi:ribA/ribD-fused uncharacterized protein
VTIWRRTYKTAEHCFQALKCVDDKEHKHVAESDTPADAKHMGRKIRKIENWNDIRDVVMFRVLTAKFSNPNLQKLLYETKNAYLIEGNSWKDTYWGKDDKTWKGENRLGELLMRLRNQIGDGTYRKKFVLTVTGHRPPKLGGYGDKAFNTLVKLGISQLKAIRPDEVITGMALGWDQAIAEACMYLNIPFVAAIPTSKQSIRWFPQSVVDYERRLSEASQVVNVSKLLHGDNEVYTAKSMQERNMFMVDNCQAVLALWDGSSGGTDNCIRYCKTKDVLIANCWNQFERMTKQ